MTAEETIIAQARQLRDLRDQNRRRHITILVLCALLALRMVGDLLR